MRRKPLKKVGQILIENECIGIDELTRGLAEQKKTGISIGAALVKLGYINQSKLEEVLAKQLENYNQKKIGELLLENGLIDTMQLAQALVIQKKNKAKLLGQILIELDYITSEQLFDILSIQFDIKNIDLSKFHFKREILNKIPQSRACELKILPLEISQDNKLLIATNQPFNIELLKRVNQIVKMEVEPVYAKEKSIEYFINEAYEFGGFLDSVKADNYKAKVEQIIDSILNRAVFEKADFVHFEPSSLGLDIKFRIFDSLEKKDTMDFGLIKGITEFFHKKASLELKQSTIKTGSFVYDSHCGKVKCRVSFIPLSTEMGGDFPKISIKIIYEEKSNISIDDLGMYSDSLNDFKNAIDSSKGIIIVAGPIDSGVTTTLYAAVLEAVRLNKNVMTLEDTIENNIKNVSQVKVDFLDVKNFQNELESVLIQDIDGLMISNINNRFAANLVFQHALDNKIILSSVSALNAVDIIDSLKKLGIEPLAISEALRAAVYQKLVKKICVSCRQSYKAPVHYIKQLSLPEKTVFFKGTGCKQCGFTGYSGRTGVFEVLVPQNTIKELIISGEKNDYIRNKAESQGMNTIKTNGIKKVIEGITTIEQVIGL